MAALKPSTCMTSPIRSSARRSPCGVYDLTANAGWVSVGIDHDTAAFAVETLRRWWRQMGQLLYPDARRLLITADGGGSNSSRNRLWKLELQRLTDELGLKVSVAHFPPGTGKWNKIEHRMFCHITQNWRGRPLVSHQVIAATTTGAGLTIRSDLDENSYPLGVKVSDDEMDGLAIRRDPCHGEWNYTLTATDIMLTSLWRQPIDRVNSPSPCASTIMLRMTDPGTVELATKLAVLEERMKTMQAEYKTDISRLAEDNARRETRLILTFAGLLAFAVAVLGLLIRWPG